MPISFPHPSSVYTTLSAKSRALRVAARQVVGGEIERGRRGLLIHGYPLMVAAVVNRTTTLNRAERRLVRSFILQPESPSPQQLAQLFGLGATTGRWPTDEIVNELIRQKIECPKKLHRLASGLITAGCPLRYLYKVGGHFAVSLLRTPAVYQQVVELSPRGDGEPGLLIDRLAGDHPMADAKRLAEDHRVEVMRGIDRFRAKLTVAERVLIKVTLAAVELVDRADFDWIAQRRDVTRPGLAAEIIQRRRRLQLRREELRGEVEMRFEKLMVLLRRAERVRRVITDLDGEPLPASMPRPRIERLDLSNHSLHDVGRTQRSAIVHRLHALARAQSALLDDARALLAQPFAKRPNWLEVATIIGKGTTDAAANTVQQKFTRLKSKLRREPPPSSVGRRQRDALARRAPAS